MKLIAPAKINLYLKVLRQRDDGYHEIETLFERISLFDYINVEPAARTTIICDNPRVPTGSGSLLARTVESFCNLRGEEAHFRITLEKNIPIAAGLGGGSSDAAALLKGLNGVTGGDIAKDELLGIARALGADVPFFLDESSFGFGKGCGDIVTKINSTMDIGHILVTPPFGVSTADVYRKVSAFGLTKNMAVDRMFTAFLNENNIASIAENLCNDLQAIVLRDFPVLEKVFSALNDSGAEGALLSGSGPTVFGIFSPEKIGGAEKKIRKTFPSEEGWIVRVAQTYNTEVTEKDRRH